MEKVVYTGLKVDFHIHSKFSSHKDGNKVKDNTIENSDVLVKKLIENNIDMAAITDHDYFSFELYKKLSENKNGIKFIPGIEFSIKIDDAKEVHVVALFCDVFEEKLKHINKYLLNDNDKPDYDLGTCFSEEKFLGILRKIDLDVVLIAHQKNSPMSRKAQKQDLSYSGIDTFNEYIGSQYFNAIELRNIRNDHFYKIYKTENQLDNMKWITGSDCHCWEVYPQYDVGKNDEIDFTYLKILPTFKGLLMAFTDESRISTNNRFYKENTNAIKELVINHNNKQTTIPLSTGINVIIGDNSVGKSALLHMLTDEINVKSKTKYKKFKKKYNLSLDNSSIIKENYRFDTQGAIRERMEDEKFNILTHFEIENESDLSNKLQIELLNAKLQTIIKSFKFQNKVLSEQELSINISYVERYSLFFEIEAYLKKSNEENLTETHDKILEVLGLLNEIFDLTGETKFKLISNILNRYEVKLKNKISQIKLEKSKKEIVNSILNEYNEKKENYISTTEKNTNDYVKSKTSFIDSIVAIRTNDIKRKQSKIDRDLDINEMDVNYIENPFNLYKLVTKFKADISKIDQAYFEQIFLSMFKKNSSYKSIIQDYSVMFKALNGKGELVESEYEAVYSLINAKFKKIIEAEFSTKSIILSNSTESDEENSMGMNSKIYFDILHSSDTNEIYMIDQPEDDLSQKALKEKVLLEFKKIAKKKQIFIVTHNPQFIVNLDVDNVIYIEKNKEELKFYSGALEYYDENYSMLDIISENIDGGSDTIEKRWKRYGN